MLLPDSTFTVMVANWFPISSTLSTFTSPGCVSLFCGRLCWSWWHSSDPTAVMYCSTLCPALCTGHPHFPWRSPTPFPPTPLTQVCHPELKDLWVIRLGHLIPSVLEGQGWSQEEAHFQSGLFREEVLPSAEPQSLSLRFEGFISILLSGMTKRNSNLTS